MTNIVTKLTDFLGVTGEGDKEKVPAPNDNEQFDRLTLTIQVEQTNLETAKKSPNSALEDVMEGWKVKGSPGDTSQEPYGHGLLCGRTPACRG